MGEARDFYHDKLKSDVSMLPQDHEGICSLLRLHYDKRVPFYDIVPEGWFKDVLDVMHESESPSPFFFLACCTVLSNLIGRKVMIDRGNHTLGLDISALLISPAGRGRRSTACDFVVYTLGEAAGLNIIADSFTYEFMGDQMVESCDERPTVSSKQAIRPKALLYAGEMAALLGKGSYSESIIPKLTDILGKTSRFNWGTVKRGKIEFVNPCVNALFTTAPDWLADNIPAVMFGGGMLSRFLICVQNQPQQTVTWGRPLAVNDLTHLVEGLRQIGETETVFPKPTKEAYKWYDKWYQTHSKKTLTGEIADERMAPYYSRKHDHLLRLTALLTLAAGEPPVFTVTKLEEALTILEWLEADMPKAYASMALGPIATAQKAVCEALDRAGGAMDHSVLLKKMWRHIPTAEMFHQVMASLIGLDVVEILPGTGKKRYRHKGLLG